MTRKANQATTRTMVSPDIAEALAMLARLPKMQPDKTKPGPARDPV